MGSEESLQKLKDLFENQKKYESDVFVKLVDALSVEAGEEAIKFLGEFIGTSDNMLLIPRIIEILGRRGDDKVIPFIVNTMKERSTPGICRETAAALRNIGTKAAKEALELLYEIKLDPVMKDLFKRNVDEIDKENPIEYVWMPKLLLGSKMASSCIDASRSLARIAKENAVPYLVKEMFNPDLLIRAVIVTALGEIGSDSVVEKLFEVFRESYAYDGMKKSYIDAIQSIRAKIESGGGEAQIFTLLEKNTPEEFSESVKKFLAVYNEKIPKKIKIEGEKLLDSGITGLSAHLVSLLRYIPHHDNETFDKAIGAVLKEIEMNASEHNRIMTEVIISLGKILEKSRAKESNIKDFLLEESEKLRDDELKARAIEMLGEIHGEDIVDKLITFTKDDSWKIREKAVYSLGEIKNKRALEVLKKSCEDMHQNVSAAAMTALGKIDHQAVIELFGSQNWRIRKLALQVARTFDDPDAIAQAQKLLDDDKYDVAFEAIETIGSIGSEECSNILGKLIMRDGSAKIHEKVLEKFEAAPNCAVLQNLVNSLSSEIPNQLFTNVQQTLINIISKVDFEITRECLKVIKEVTFLGMGKNEMKIKLNSVTLASELRELEIDEYKEVIGKLKEYEKYRSSRNPHEKTLAVAADNSISILEKKINEINQLMKNKERLISLYDEIFDKNEMRSKNAIAEVWKLFSTTKLSNDADMKAEIWGRFSKRFLMPETSPYTREGLAKIFGEFGEPRAVPLLLKFRESKVHAERLAIESALKKLTETFSKEEILGASTGKGIPAPTQAGAKPEAAAPAAEAAPAPPEKADYKVLIVDDALVMRNLYSKMLKKSGYITDVAKDGVETLLKIKNNEYDIILLDLKLPDVNGLDILRQVPEVAKNKNARVIIISSYLDEENSKKAMELGAAAVFAKPLDIDMLSSKIKIILR